MTKSREETVAEFDELVNMTADELEAWLETEASQTTGQPNPSSAVRPRSPSEPVGHASGRHILSILRRGGASSLPAASDDADGEANDGGDLAHARRTVAYLRRHLAQEREANAAKSADELEKTKSYRSLKNWGHDALKERNKGGSSSGGEGKEKGEGAADGEKKTPAKTTTKTTTPAKRKAAGGKADGKETDDDDDDDDDNEDDDEAAEEQPDDDDDAAAAEGEEGEDDDDNDEGGVDDEDDKDKAAQGSEEDDEVEDDEDEDDAEEPKAKKAKRS